MADNALLNQIKNGNTKQLAAVYAENRDEFLSWLCSNYNCNAEQAKDIYQASTLALLENIQMGKLLTLTGSLKTYLFAIGKNKAREWQRDKSRNMLQFQLIGIEIDEQIDIQEIHKKEAKYIQVSQQLEKLGDPCKSLLELFYFKTKTVEEITNLLGYRNKDTTKNLKYKCLSRLKKLYAAL